MGKTRQVIIGNSAAGLAAIQAIREIDKDCRIDLISAEQEIAYSPVLLTYYLGGRITRGALYIIDNAFYENHDINRIFGSKAIGLDVSKQIIHLENGQKIKYDNLLIATGASPVSLGGPEIDRVLTLRSIKDTDTAMAKSEKAKESVVVGAGLIGMQTADALLQRGIKLNIVELAGQVFPENIDPACAAILQEEIINCGVMVHLGKRVKEIKNKGKKVVVSVDSGEEWAGDLAMVGIGLTPNHQFAKESGIKINKGIVVDDFIRTNIGNVYAAGDVSEGLNMVSGKKEILATWSNARRQGRVAGLNMAGKEEKYAGGLRETVTGVFGMNVAAVGSSRSKNGFEELKFSDHARKIYRKFLLEGNRIIGAVLLNRMQDIGLINNFIRNRTDISPWIDSIARTPLTIQDVVMNNISPKYDFNSLPRR